VRDVLGYALLCVDMSLLCVDRSLLSLNTFLLCVNTSLSEVYGAANYVLDAAYMCGLLRAIRLPVPVKFSKETS